MKKVLALIVAFALCFTAFAGCFATSAAAPEFSVTADGNVVTVAGTIAEASQYAVMLNVTLAEDLKLVSVADAEGTVLKAYPEEGWDYVVNGNSIASLELYDNTFTYVITVEAPANNSCDADASYDVTVKAEYADYNADAPTLEKYEGTASVVVPAKAHAAADDAEWDNNETNHWKYCAAHADVKVEEAAHDYNAVVTEPTTEAGGYTTYTCKVCAYAYTADETDPLPPAGPKEFTVNLNNRTLQLESKILVNVWVLESELPAGYNLNNMFLAVTKTGETEPVIVTPVRGKNGNNWYYRFAYDGLSSVEMGVKFEYYVYKTDENGVITDISNSNTYAVVDYIESILVKYENDSTAKRVKLCNLLADVANYGAAAQTNFKLNTDKLINEWSADVIRLVDKFETKTDPSLELCSNPTDEGLVVNTTLDLQSEVRINYVVKKSDVDAKITALSATRDDLKFVVTYLDGATEEYTGTEITTYYSGATPYYCATFKGFNATQFREVASCVVYVGNTKISQTKQMSMEGYAKSIINKNNNPSLMALVTAMMKYGDSAYAYVNA